MYQEQEVTRVRLPQREEVIGEIDQVLGASRFRVSCSDGKVRLCRIPGKFREMIKIRAGFVVIVRPWEVEPDSKGDIVFIYTKTEAGWLRKKGLIK